jgi:hypothetical protein
MTRQTKIRLAVVLAVAGLIAAFWLRMNQVAVRVTFAGVASNDSSVVWFTVTNCSTTPLVYFRTAQEHHSNTWVDLEYRDRPSMDAHQFQGTLPGHSATNFKCSVTYLKPWRVEVACSRKRSGPSLMFRIRTRMAQYASRRNWSRLSPWLRPVTKWDYAYGPEMIVNQPVVPGRP